MREILFRGKIIEPCHYCGQWLEGFYGVDDGKTFIAIQQKNGLNGFFCDPLTVGQYTGLRDKNSTRIFEGDIVKVYDVYCNETVVGVVEFCDGSFRIYDKDFTSYGRWMYGKVEVIGNVYDDVNLLEA